MHNILHWPNHCSALEMSGLEKRKRKRGGRVGGHLNVQGPRGAMDLFVPVPRKTATLALDAASASLVPQKVMLDRILSRLQATGFKQVALTHTIYGRPREPDDRADVALPAVQVKHGMNVLRRLHVVVENLSDMALFAPQSPSLQQLLNEYDLISISPRNEAAFQAACACAGADIVTLEGNATAAAAGGSSNSSNSLPYKLRSTDVRAVIHRRAVLEIPYGVPVLNRAARKGLVQTSRELQTTAAGVGKQLMVHGVLLSSGSRRRVMTTESGGTDDVGPPALRSPGDLANLLHSVMGFDSRTAANAVSSTGQVALDHAARRRFGGDHQSIRVTSVSIETGDFKKEENTVYEKSGASAAAVADVSKVEEITNEGGVGDGFISF